MTILYSFFLFNWNRYTYNAIENQIQRWVDNNMPGKKNKNCFSGLSKVKIIEGE